MDTALSFLHLASVPLKFWSRSFWSAVYLINRLPTPLLGLKSPFQFLFNSTQNPLKLMVFCCLCYLWLKPHTSTKLDPCAFMGYSASIYSYACLDLATLKIYIFIHVVFVEQKFSIHNKLSSVLLPTCLAHGKMVVQITSLTLPVPHSLIHLILLQTYSNSFYYWFGSLHVYSWITYLTPSGWRAHKLTCNSSCTLFVFFPSQNTSPYAYPQPNPKTPSNQMVTRCQNNIFKSKVIFY